MDLNALKARAYMLMTQHGLRDLGWVFKFDRCKNSAGRCSYSHKIISMSAPIIELNSELECLNTLLHEIAHALVGAGHGHNRVWKFKAIEIGARPQACFTEAEKVVPPPKYIAYCMTCDKMVAKRHRLTARTRAFMGHITCMRNGGGNIRWVENESTIASVPQV